MSRHLQNLALNCTDNSEMLRHFTNWGTEECNSSFLATSVLSALMPTEGVDQVATWFHSAITDIDVVSDLVLLVAIVLPALDGMWIRAHLLR